MTANVRNSRSGLAADFTATNPYLGDGEERVETDTHKTKTGPGYWNDLSYNEGGTSGASGQPVVRAFPFAFNSAGILTGHALYTPTIGDLLIDAWVHISTGWDGTTPAGDIGTFTGGQTTGLYSLVTVGGDVATNYQAGLDMTASDGEFINGLTSSGQNSRLSDLLALDNVYTGLDVPVLDGNAHAKQRTVHEAVGHATTVSGYGQGIIPAVFATADPIKIVVSQDGTVGGADPASTMGAGVLYLVTCTPA